MLGYVVTDKPELKVKDYEGYRGYYCGICKATARLHGQLPRFALSYDFAFLAVLLDGLREENHEMELQHCIIHPIKKNPVVINNDVIDYSADIMLLLVYYNLLDDKNDEHKIRGSLGAGALHRKAKKVAKKYPKMAETIEENLKYLTSLEQEKNPSVDMTGDAFSEIMCQVFAGEGAAKLIPDNQIRQLSHLGKNLGRFIYIIDALSDLEDDIKSGSYNPLIYRFEFQKKDNLDEDIPAFRSRIKSQMEIILMSCLTEIENAYSLLDIKKNKGILDNIIYFGLLKQTEKVLGKGTEKNEKSI